MYDRFRPGYFDDVFARMIEVTGLQDEAQVLEIGAGAGQATVPMATRGYNLTAVEPGITLAEITREKTRKHPLTRVITGAFEEVELEPQSFDLIYSAMALHWVPENQRFTKPHLLLKNAGHLAIIYSEPFADESTEEFFAKSLPIYKQYGLIEEDDEYIPPPLEGLDWQIHGGLDTELFKPIEFYVAYGARQYPSSLHYAAFLHTLSRVMALREEPRDAFLGDVRKVIDEDCNGQLKLPIATTLAIAQKK